MLKINCKLKIKNCKNLKLKVLNLSKIKLVVCKSQCSKAIIKIFSFRTEVVMRVIVSEIKRFKKTIYFSKLQKKLMIISNKKITK